MKKIQEILDPPIKKVFEFMPEWQSQLLTMAQTLFTQMTLH
jgi:hypothetical protein